MPEYRKKLIEVALPLEAINKESAREKSIRHGHPSTLHLWWSRKPLATCRAVLFAQMVDDPSSIPDEFPTEEVQDAERQRLFRIIEELVKWENTTNEAVLHPARVEIIRSAARNHGVSLPHSMTPVEVANALRRYAPPISDCFCGGGSIPLEAQRLGLEVDASDLNPVAVLVTKSLVEIPPKFAGLPPVNPEATKLLLQHDWHGMHGLAEDVRYYGHYIREEAWKLIGHLYPRARLSNGSEATVIAWIWVRTVNCPNPACGIRMPLTSKWTLATKVGKEVWVEPEVDHSTSPSSFRFVIRTGKGKMPEVTVGRKGAICLSCGTPMSLEYIRTEGQAGRMNVQMIAMAVEGKGSRIYLHPTPEHELVAQQSSPQHVLDTELPIHALGFSVQHYGPTRHRDLYTSRQLIMLTTLSDLIAQTRDVVKVDAKKRGVYDDGVALNKGGQGATAYADAVATYLALGVDKIAEASSAICTWSSSPKNELVVSTFRRQAIALTWDFAEANPFGPSSGTITGTMEFIAKAIRSLPTVGIAHVAQKDAMSIHPQVPVSISTDPPYYDNIGYADLSDFFYVWLRRSLSRIYPDLFSTLLVPKSEELIADPFRRGSREEARRYFEEGLSKAFIQIRASQDLDYPLSVYYGFKQSEAEDDKDGNRDLTISSTGWETMLTGLLSSGFTITGTWPIRTERGSRSRSIGSNDLASSIVLICRPRPIAAPLTTRRDFLNALKRELPKALKDLQRGNIAPVDLAQAAIGPGMAVFSRYSKVLESDGTPMRVRTALQLINQTLDEVLAEQEGEYDANTRWAVAWFEQYGMEEGPYGVAETLSKAKNTAVGTLVEAGILQAQGGKVRLLDRKEFSNNWNPDAAKRLTTWEVTQRLIQALQEKGDAGAAAILNHIGAYGEVARDLAYRLYTICERKKWADEALAYNSLVVEWSDISGTVDQLRRTTAEQSPLFS